MSKVNEVKQNIDLIQMELGGKLRTLQFDMNAFAELEARFGSVETAMEKLSEGKMADVRLILWVSLIHEEAILDEVSGEPKGYNITPYQVGSWIKNPAMLREASAKIGQIMTSSLPQAEDVDDELVSKLAEQGFRIGANGLEKIEDDSKN